MEICMEPLFASPGIFFILGGLLSRLNKQPHLPREILRFLSIYLVISIGLKGGGELRHLELMTVLRSVGIGMALGLIQGTILFYGLQWFSHFKKEDQVSLAAHYGSVSVGTFMVGVAFLKGEGIPFESELYLFLVGMEFPAILIVLGLYQLHHAQSEFSFSSIVRKVFYHETIAALLFGLVVGTFSTELFLDSIKPFYSDLFVGMLTFFMLCMGIETGIYWDEVKNIRLKFIGVGVGLQIVGAILGLITGISMGFSVGGAFLLMVLAGSASYIVAPCIMRESLPQANNSGVFLLSLGITFPLNVLIGIKLYLAIVQSLF